MTHVEGTIDEQEDDSTGSWPPEGSASTDLQAVPS